VDRLVAVGGPARAIAQAAAAAPRPVAAESVADTDAAVRWLRAELHPGDVVLVKASRAASLERVARAIVEDGATDANRGPEDCPA
jgi:UDP-N-acetylmuramoyl-tripeptide--D-alanyl-D-alanine ligase